MESYEAEADIHAHADTVWQIITDGSGYPSWDSGITRIEGTIADGQKIKVHAAVSPGRTFPVAVAQSANHRTMTWTGGMPLGLFKGVRTFTLTPDGDITHLRVREEYSGPLLGMIRKSMPDLGPSFSQYVNGVRARAENPPA